MWLQPSPKIILKASDLWKSDPIVLLRFSFVVTMVTFISFQKNPPGKQVAVDVHSTLPPKKTAIQNCLRKMVLSIPMFSRKPPVFLCGSSPGEDRFERSRTRSSAAPWAALEKLGRWIFEGRFGKHQPSQREVGWVVSKIFYVYPYLGEWSNLTNIFQMVVSNKTDGLTALYSAGQRREHQKNKRFLFSPLFWRRFPFWLIFFKGVETTN